MNDVEAIKRIEQLSHDGCLVWASCRPAMAGGGWAVRIIGTIGPDRMGHGQTLGEALADALDVRADVDLAHSIGLEF